MLFYFKHRVFKFSVTFISLQVWISSTQQHFHASLTCKLLGFAKRIQRLFSIFFLLLCGKVSNGEAARICIRILIYYVEYIQTGFLSANHDSKCQLQTHLLHFLFRVYILLCPMPYNLLYLCFKIFTQVSRCPILVLNC